MAFVRRRLLARRRIPQARAVVLRCGHDALAIGAERRALYTLGMALQGGDLLARRRIPDARAVSSEDAVTMRRPSGLNAALSHCAGMALQGGDLLARRRIPEARGVVRRGHDALAIGAERRALTHVLGMAFQDGDLFSRRRIPDARAVVGQTRSRCAGHRG